MSEDDSQAAAPPLPAPRVTIQDVAPPADAPPIRFTKDFTVEEIDPLTGGKRLGNFTVRRLTLKDYQDYGVILARFSGGEANITPEVEYINRMVALCQVALTNVPPWWKPSEFFDDEVLGPVHKHVRSFQDSFRSAPGKQGSGSPAGGSPAAG